MSKNIQQIYVANPITSNARTDLMYFGQSPYGVGDDAAMLYSNFALQFSLRNPWSTISGTTQAAAVFNNYVIGNASQTTVTLPVTAAVGSTIAIAGQGAGGWILAPGAGQTIKILTGSASASITSAERYDAIEVVCVVQNTTWVVRSCMTTGFTVS